MASAAQVLANRSNAQKSTGPRTPEGKAVVSQNAVKHGLLAREVVIKGEDSGEFEFYRDQMLMYERRIEHEPVPDDGRASEAAVDAGGRAGHGGSWIGT
jgi:hypothetical protein